MILWDVAARKPLGEPLAGHEAAGSRASPSAPTARPSPRRVQDKTVILWDVAARKPLGEPLTGHKDAVYERRLQPRRQDARLGESGPAP